MDRLDRQGGTAEGSAAEVWQWIHQKHSGPARRKAPSQITAGRPAAGDQQIPGVQVRGAQALKLGADTAIEGWKGRGKRSRIRSAIWAGVRPRLSLL